MVDLSGMVFSNSEVDCVFISSTGQVNLPGHGNTRGLYLREPHQLSKLSRFHVVVEPKFSENAGIYLALLWVSVSDARHCTYYISSDVSEKQDFELQLALVATESWIQTTKHLVLWNGGQ